MFIQLPGECNSGPNTVKVADIGFCVSRQGVIQLMQFEGYLENITTLCTKTIRPRLEAINLHLQDAALSRTAQTIQVSGQAIDQRHATL